MHLFNLEENNKLKINAPVEAHCIQMLVEAAVVETILLFFFSVNNPVIFCCFKCRRIQSLDMIDDEVRLRLRASGGLCCTACMSLCLLSRSHLSVPHSHTSFMVKN